MVEYHRKWREENKNRLLAYLLSHPCVDCGEKDPVVLEFDHIDPTKKRYEVGYLVGRRSSWKQIQEEISLCDVVCANCHKRRTAKQQNWSKANPIKI
jgi:hypothetical protein